MPSPLPDLQPYRRGFLLHRRGTGIGPVAHWPGRELGASGWILRHDPQESAEFLPLADGRRWVLVYGLCLYAGDDERRLSPARRLAEALQESDEALLDALDHLGGRHAVLTGDGPDVVLRQDALGMRSVCFSPKAALVSSHAHLIHDISAHPLRTSRNGRPGILHVWGRTPYLGIEALLPNHELHLTGWRVRRFYPRRPNAYRDMPLDERLDLFRRRWSRQMQELAARPEQLVMSLTGGADSRTTLALNWDHLRRLSLFTYTADRRAGSRHRESLAKDERIVERLRVLLPEARHSFFRIEDRSAGLTPEQESVVARNTYGKHGAWLLPHYLREFSAEAHIHLRGFGYEVGRAYWNVAEDNSTIDSLEQLFLHRTAKTRPTEPAAERRAVFRRGLQRWQYDTDLHGMHLRDLYYWEMRMGRWGAEVLNETDLAFETCVQLNVRSLLEISLSLPIEDRRSGFLFAELINASYPLLNFFGKNDDRNLYEITRDAARSGRGAGAPDPAVPSLEASSWLRRPGDAEGTAAPGTGTQLSIPARSFREGASSSRRFEPLEHPGELRFTIASTYGDRAAAGHWRLQVLVDDEPRISWDGGRSSSPVHVRLADLRSGARVSVAAVALRDHEGSATWAKASRAWIRDVEFSPAEPAGPATAAVDVPDATRPELGAQPPRVAPHDIPGLSPRLFPLETPTRLDLVVEGRRVPLLVVRRAHSGRPRVLTLFNGAVDLERSQREPVFQRSSWWRDIPGTQIYVADPGSLGTDALSLSWGQVSAGTSVIPGTVRALRLLAGVLGAAEPSQRTYFGSSAGGFWAWSAAALDDGSRAVVNNAQIDWTRWMAEAVNELRFARFDGILPATLRERLPQRTSVLRLWEATGAASQIDYWVNIASKHDRIVDLPQVEAFARQRPDLAAHLHIHRYEDDAAGHNPLSRDATLRAILTESEPTA